MDGLHEFRSMDFLEQVALLKEIETGKDAKTIEGLCAFLEDPIGDDAVDTMVRATLRVLLLENEDQTLEGLDRENAAVRNFCVGIVAEKGFSKAGPRLLELSGREKDPEALLGILRAMAEIKAPEFLGVFQEHLRSEDPLLAEIAVRMIGVYRDHSSLPVLREIVAAGERDDRYETCDVITWSAINSLAALGSPDALDFLVEEIHHKNPTARRFIHESLVQIGPDVLDPLFGMFQKGDRDQKIMAVNVMGFMGHEGCLDVLIQALEPRDADPNVVFAAYDSLGNIPSAKAFARLLKALCGERDEAGIIAAAGAVDKQIGHGVVQSPDEIVQELKACNQGQMENILRAVVSAKAVNLFEVLYRDQALADELIERIAASRDRDVVEAFRTGLAGIGDPRAAKDAEKLPQPGEEDTDERAKLLAIDDSGSMLNFYRGVAGDLGFAATTAENGKIAWDILERGLKPDVIVVDMNMPEMDGIEFTTRVRGNPLYEGLPIVMATTESEKSQARLAKNAGVDAFLIKPFKAEVLSHRIKKVLERGSAAT